MEQLENNKVDKRGGYSFRDWKHLDFSLNSLFSDIDHYSTIINVSKDAVKCKKKDENLTCVNLYQRHH